MTDNPGIWITSGRDADARPTCKINWGHIECYPPVAAVRATAIDLVTCAAYAEMMMRLVHMGADGSSVSKFTTDLLRDTGRRYFGDPSTIMLMPAGSTARRESLVMFTRGSMKATVTSAEAREMALAWLEAAEATESDQLVSEALRATRIADGPAAAALFGYLQQLRSPAGAPQ